MERSTMLFMGKFTISMVILVIFHSYMLNYQRVTTSLFSRALGMMVSGGDYPQMTASFRLVNSHNLPRHYVLCHIHFLVNQQNNQLLFQLLSLINYSYICHICLIWLWKMAHLVQ